MRSKKFTLLIVVLVLLLSQVPFVYRRFKLRRLDAVIQQLNTQRTTGAQTGFVDYRGVVHVHSSLGGHSAGTFSEIISAAQANGLQFVIMTEHTVKDFDTASLTLKGMHGGVLFINGNEVSAENGDRLLVLPEEISIVAYPEEFRNWETAGLDGVEIYNVFTNARRVNPVAAFFDVLWSQRAYPELIFALYLQRPDESLKKWDQALARTRLTATRSTSPDCCTLPSITYVAPSALNALLILTSSLTASATAVLDSTIKVGDDARLEIRLSDKPAAR